MPKPMHVRGPQEQQTRGLFSRASWPSYPNYATFQKETVSATTEKMDEWRQLFTSFCHGREAESGLCIGSSPWSSLNGLLHPCRLYILLHTCLFVTVEYSFRR